MIFRRHPQVCFAAGGEGAGAPSPEASPIAPAAGAEPSKSEAAPASEPVKAEPAKAAEPDPSSTSLLSEAEGEGEKKPEPQKEPEKPQGEAAKTEGEKKPEAKAEEPKVEPEKAADAVEPPPPEPVKYEPFKLPEGMKLDGDSLKSAEAILGSAQVPQEKAQELIDLYVADTQRMRAEADKHQQDVWAEQINKWKDEFRKDSDLGGNREATTLSTAKAVIEDFGGTKEQQADLLAQLNRSGMGNNLGLIRLLHNIGKKLGVHEDNIVSSPSSGRGGRGFGDGWYDKGKGATA